MDIRILKEPIAREEAAKIGKEFYKEMVKGVADVRLGVVAIGGEYHADANELLINNGSSQADVWGFNYYFNRPQNNCIEYTSLINIRPAADNRTMTVENKKICETMEKLIKKFIL